MAVSYHNIQLQDLLAKCDLELEDVLRANTSVEELYKIYLHHLTQIASLELTGADILDRLTPLREVHSVRSRVKNPIRLIRKIVRKRLEDPTRLITLDNYEDDITDLVGIRALHLFKEDWEAIHDFITHGWKVRETPIAYVREGDREDWIHEFKLRGCVVKKHPHSYRSVHYLIPASPTKRVTTVEVQVRTLMEEAWSEIDHRINYPEATPYQEVRHFLGSFNRLAGMADEMGSFVNGLEQRFQAADKEKATAKDLARVEYERLIEKLRLTPDQRRTLDRELAVLAQKSASAADVGTSTIKPITEAVDAAKYLTDSVAPATFADLLQGITITRTCTRCRERFRTAASNANVEPLLCDNCAAPES